MAEGDISFQNMDSWRGSSGNKYGLTYEQIVLQHINRCVTNGSVEWHGGFWQESGNNPCTRTYVYDSRDVYCNSVKMLRALLIAYFDKGMSSADTKLQDEWKEKYEEYKNAEGKGKEITSEFRAFKIDWHIRMFEELVQLAKRLNFFEEEESEGEEV